MIANPTHKVVITIVSDENKPDVNLQVNWDPLLSDDELKEIGYIPAAYTLAENVLFSLETAMQMATLLELDEGDLGDSRTLN